MEDKARNRHDSIDTIIGAIKAPAMANQFEVAFFGPQGLTLNAVRCKTATIPSRKLEVTEKVTQGKGKFLPTGKIDDGGTATFTFYADIDFLDRKIVQLWLDSIYGGDTAAPAQSSGSDPNTQPIFAYYKDYIGEVEIKHLRKDGYNPTFASEGQQGESLIVRLHEAYPTSIDEITLDMAQGEMLSVSVQFAYRYFTTEYVDSKNPTKTPHPVYNGEGTTPNGLNSGRSQLDNLQEALAVGSRFSSSAGRLQDKVSGLQTAKSRIDNSYKNVRDLFGTP